MNDLLAIQDTYNAETAICYGCGRHNAHGLHIRSFWDGSGATSHFTPRPEHTAFPGVVYGGLLASLVDCHSIGTAIASMYQREGREAGTAPEISCVTANLNVTYLKPTPMGVTLRLYATPKEVTDKKAIIVCSIFAGDLETIRAEVVAVRVKARMGTQLGE